jgi:hypothetical protein
LIFVKPDDGLRAASILGRIPMTGKGSNVLEAVSPCGEHHCLLHYGKKIDQATVPSENSVQILRMPFPEANPKPKQFAAQLESGKWNPPRHASARKHSPDADFRAQREAARSLVDSGLLGSPSFVAVVQSTDLR